MIMAVADNPFIKMEIVNRNDDQKCCPGKLDIYSHHLWTQLLYAVVSKSPGVVWKSLKLQVIQVSGQFQIKGIERIN